MKRFTALLLCALMVLSLTSCKKDVQEPEPVEPPEPTAKEIYDEAAAKVKAMTDMTLDISYDKEMTVGIDTYVTHTAQTLDLRGIGGETFAASLTENAQNGMHILKASETYTAGKLYATLRQYNYTSEVKAEDYLAQFVPAVALDSSLYSTIEKQEDGNMKFSDASALESWLNVEDGVMLSASGFAEFNDDGSLKKCTYNAEYIQGTTQFSIVASATIRELNPLAVFDAPADAQDFNQIEDWTAPKLMENAGSYAAQSLSISCTTSENVICQAGNFTDMIQTTTNTYSKDDIELAEIDYSSMFMNLSTNEADAQTYVQQYKDGVFSTITDGGEPRANRTVPYDTILSDCKFNVTTLVPELDTVSKFDLQDTGSSYLLVFNLNDDYGEDMCKNVCGLYFDDENVLSDNASDYRTGKIEGYIGIDKTTGLMTTAATSYIGYHTIEGVEYMLGVTTNSSVHLSGTETYEVITGEPLPIEEPAEKATPLFYHVTGANGEELWLMGTIHVGDARTSYLPQEIYDAFDSSDALAVEFDIDEFMERASTDPELMTLIAQKYIYTDGTLTQNHISDNDLYLQSLRQLMTTGDYNDACLLMKPSIWSSEIENFYISQGYKLTSDLGMDEMLLKMANEKEKEILNVESGEEQLDVITGYSDEVQELILEGTMEIGQNEYNRQLQELYELWCSGDEAALREAVKDDISDLTEEELALYEEYNNDMTVKRNEKMLEVAKGYLSGDKTVFYAVGLAHLLTENGLVNTLRNAGYTVELVTYR